MTSGSDTPQAQSADTPESVAARVEEALETCAAQPAIAADATGLLSNFIGCVEKGRGSALDAGDGRAARFALELLLRRDRAQAAEIARLSKRLEEMERVRSCAVADHVAAEAALAAARADYAAVMAEIGVESIADVPALLSAERAKAQALRDALQRTLSAAKTAEDREVEIGEDLARHFDALISGVVFVAEAALFTDPTEEPAPADRMTATVIPYTDEDDLPDHDMDGWSMVFVGVDGGIPDYVFDRIPTSAAQTICDLINHGPSHVLARELAVVKARTAGLLPATAGEGR